MIDYTTFKLENLTFYDDLSWIGKLRFRLALILFRLIGFPPPQSVTLKKKRFLERLREMWWKLISLRVLLHAIGIENQGEKKKVSFHDRRLLLWPIFYFGGVCFLIVIFVYLSVGIEIIGGVYVTLSTALTESSYLSIPTKGYGLFWFSAIHLYLIEGVPIEIVGKLEEIDYVASESAFRDALRNTLSDDELALYEAVIMKHIHVIPGNFRITQWGLNNLQSEGIPEDVLTKLTCIKNQSFETLEAFKKALRVTLGDEQATLYEAMIVKYAFGASDPIMKFVQRWFIIVFFPLLYILFSFIFRFSMFSVNRYFAESLCLHVVLGIVIDLCQDDVLIHPMKRTVLLSRMGYLQKTTRLLASRFGKRTEVTQQWLDRHFHKISAYIQERERQVFAPTDSSLHDLQQDFYQLATIYSSGNYGDPVWKDVVVEEAEAVSLSWRQRALKGMPRFVGIILPLILMGIYLWQPAVFPFIAVDSSIVTLIFIAWLLLAIDASLNLGIVSSIVNLAKGIKDLK